MTAPDHPTDEPVAVDLRSIELVDVMRALADPVRLRIAQVLLPGEAVARSKTDWDCDLSRATMSHHFRVLRDAGLIYAWASGRTQLVQLRVDDITKHVPGLLQLLARDATTDLH